MNFIYLGAEVPSNRILLESTTVTHVGFSFYRLLRRGLPAKGYLIADRFPDRFQVHLHPGWPKDEDNLSLSLEEFSALYEAFVASNMDRLSSFSEIDTNDQAFVIQQRKTCWSEVPPGKFLPVWNPVTGFKELNALAERYLDIGLPGSAIEDEVQLAAVARTLARQGTRFHILGSAKPDNLRQVPAESASTLSWLAPMMNGETIVWDGTRLSRYPKRMKDQARARYRHVYARAGLDEEKILNDDDKELCRLAIWSYQQYEARLNGVNIDDFLYDNSDDEQGDDSAETTPAVVDNKGVQARKLAPRETAEITNLPVFGYEVNTELNEDGVIQDRVSVTSQQVSLRACDTCFVASNCPAFKPASVCAFKLPVEVKTKDQLKALLNALLEMQGQRIAFMRFAEEMNGGYADPNLSQEMDRFFKLVKTVKELDDSREFIRMTVERQGSAGVLSNIFGDRANVLKELPANGLDETQTTRIIKDLTEDS